MLTLAIHLHTSGREEHGCIALLWLKLSRVPHLDDMLLLSQERPKKDAFDYVLERCEGLHGETLEWRPGGTVAHARGRRGLQWLAAPSSPADQTRPASQRSSSHHSPITHPNPSPIIHSLRPLLKAGYDRM